MNKTAIADIDASMANLAATISGEEHQITTLQAVAADGWGAHTDQLAGRTWQFDARRIAVDIANQTAAIKAAIRGIAAVAIGSPDQTEGAKKHILSIAVKAADRCMHNRFWGWRGGIAGAGTEQRGKHNQAETGDSGHGRAILSRDAPYSAGLHIVVQALALLGRLLKIIEIDLKYQLIAAIEQIRSPLTGLMGDVQPTRLVPAPGHVWPR